MKRPYIGITGFTAKDEVAAALSQIKAYPGGFGEYLFMNGVLVSHGTLKGLPHKNPQLQKRYPEASRSGRLFPDSEDVLNLYHYNTPHRQFVPELEKLIQYGGAYLDGFQLNLAWPDPRELQKFREAGHAQTIVLQIGKHAFAKVDNDPKKLTEKIKAEYIDLVDYILLDPSGGWAKELDVDVMRGYIRELYHQLIQERIMIGFAGGITWYNQPKIVVPLVSEFKGLSMDLEGSVRDKKSDELLFTEVHKVIEAFHTNVVMKQTQSQLI